MRFVSFRAGGRARFGLARADGIVDLTDRLAGRFDSLDAVAIANAWSEAAAAGAGAAPDVAPEAIDWLAPIARPGKILCIGVNYRDRSAEQGDAQGSKYPNVFLRTPESFAPHRAAIVRPRVSEQFDYEGEIVLVIGKRGRYIDRANALSHVAGLTIANEGSVRDWMRHGQYNITQGKNFDASGSIGPWIDTTPLAPDYDLRVRTWVNDELRQDDTTANMIWPFDYLISYLSQFTTLHPGDLILTGTPTGAGVRFKPPKWLRPGDRLRIEVSGVGTLENLVADEASA